jgi:NADH-quinone oxidoreductase subunit E
VNAPSQQDTAFTFSAENRSLVKQQIAKYPKGRQQSAVLAVLDLAQRQCGGWLPQSAIEAVAETLEMPKIRALEVATFYSMFNLRPVGRHVVEICTTTPCALRGAAGIEEACQQHLKIPFGGTTADGMFTLREVECLGACVNAPMMQIGDHYYEDLTPESAVTILEAFARGAEPDPGSQSGRQTSAPDGGPTTLTELGEGGD